MQPYTLALLLEPQRTEWQSTMCTKILVDLMFAEGKRASVKDFLSVVDFEKVRVEVTLREEMQSLHELSNPWDQSPENVQRTLDYFLQEEGCENLIFHKSLSLYSTGMEMVEHAKEVRTSLLDDKQAENAISKLVVPQSLTDEMLIATGKLNLPNKLQVKKFSHEYEQLLQMASDRLQARADTAEILAGAQTWIIASRDRMLSLATKE